MYEEYWKIQVDATWDSESLLDEEPSNISRRGEEKIHLKGLA